MFLSTIEEQHTEISSPNTQTRINRFIPNEAVMVYSTKAESPVHIAMSQEYISVQKLGKYTCLYKYLVDPASPEIVILQTGIKYLYTNFI